MSYQFHIGECVSCGPSTFLVSGATIAQSGRVFLDVEETKSGRKRTMPAALLIHVDGGDVHCRGCPFLWNAGCALDEAHAYAAARSDRPIAQSMLATEP